MPGKKEQVLFCRLSDRQRVMYEAFLQSDQVKQVMRGSTQILGAITMLRKICNHPDLVCPPGDSSLETFIKKGSFSEEDLFQHEFSDDDGDVLDEVEDGDDVSDRSGKLEVLAKILPLWKKQGHRYVDVLTATFCFLSSCLKSDLRYLLRVPQGTDFLSVEEDVEYHSTIYRVARLEIWASGWEYECGIPPAPGGSIQFR